MLGVKRMPRPLSESRKPESRRKTAVLRGMRLRRIDSPPGFPGQPCRKRERGCLACSALAGVIQMRWLQNASADPCNTLEQNRRSCHGNERHTYCELELVSVMPLQAQPATARLLRLGGFVGWHGRRGGVEH